MGKPKLFISYRREDGISKSVGWMAATFKAAGWEVFWDIKIPTFSEWKEVLDENVKQCDVMVAAVGPKWGDILKAKQKSLESDYVCFELNIAIKRNIPVGAVLIDGGQMPREHDLPDDIRRLAAFQAAVLQEASFSRDLDLFVEAVEEIHRRNRGRKAEGDVKSQKGAPEMIQVPAGASHRGFTSEQVNATVELTRRDYPRLDPNSVRTALSDEPVRKVNLPGFAIGATLVTNAQFAEFVNATGHITTAETRRAAETWRGKMHLPDHPVVWVSYADAKAYSLWCGCTLPTFDEWIRAYRGDDGRLYPWGDQYDAGKCNTNESCKGETTTAVHRFSSGRSPFGCYDLVGNVEEWTETADEDGFHAILGGSYADPCGVKGLPFAHLYARPEASACDRGFRCVRR